VANPILNLYRVFSRRTQLVWGQELTSHELPYLTPGSHIFRALHPDQFHIYNKEAMPTLAEECIRIYKIVGGKPWTDLAKILEAYPASYHHAATQEIGLGLGIDYPGNKNKFHLWPGLYYTLVGEKGESQYVRYLTDEDLLTMRNGKMRMPFGMDPKIWLEYKHRLIAMKKIPDEFPTEPKK